MEVAGVAYLLPLVLESVRAIPKGPVPAGNIALFIPVALSLGLQQNKLLRLCLFHFTLFSQRSVYS